VIPILASSVHRYHDGSSDGVVLLVYIRFRSESALVLGLGFPASAPLVAATWNDLSDQQSG
jgi:hypothetical protein